MHTFPFEITEAVKMEKQIFRSTPWFSPCLMALEVVQVQSPKLKKLIIAYEWPIPSQNTHEKMSKELKEQLHLDRFNTDCKLSMGLEIYSSYKPGGNPPDFRVIDGGSTIKLDLAQFTIESRRRANALIENLKNRIYADAPSIYKHLCGNFLYVKFGAGGGESDMPYSHRDKLLIDKFVDDIKEFAIDPSKFYKFSSMPQKMPELNSKITSENIGLYVAPLENAVPDTNFFKRMGFEIGLCFQSEHTAEEACKEIFRLIQKHDKPEIDELLISAGAPNESGFLYPADELLLSYAAASSVTQNIQAPKYLKKVYLHIWSTGEIFTVLPDYRRINSALYEGMVPAHHKILPRKA